LGFREVSLIQTREERDRLGNSSESEWLGVAFLVFFSGLPGVLEWGGSAYGVIFCSFLLERRFMRGLLPSRGGGAPELLLFVKMAEVN